MSTANDMKVKGNECLAKKDFMQAIEWYTKGIELEPNNHVLYSNRSAAYLSVKSYEQAIQDGDKCIQLNPTWDKGYNRKYAAQMASGDLEGCEQTLKAGVQACGETPLLKKSLNELAESARNSMGAGLQDVVNSMIQHLQSNPQASHLRNDPTLLPLLQQIRSNPNTLFSYTQDPRIMQLMSMAMGIDLNQPGSQPAPEPAPKPTSKPAPKPAPQPELSEEEKTVAALKTEGNALYKAKQFTEALAKYEAILAIQPANIPVRNNIGAVYLEQGKYDDCLAFCQETLTIARENRASYEDIAKTLMRMGTAEVKRENYDQAIEYFESSRMEVPLKGIEDRIRQATKLKEEAAKKAYIDPKKGLEAKERGNQFFLNGKFPEAIREYDEAIRRDPTNAAFYCNRGTALSKLMDYGRALNDINKALELDPTYVKALVRRGNIEFALKQYHRAMRSFREGLAINENDETCLEGLQRTMMKINETSHQPIDPEQQRRSMEDPEIKAIMSDPNMQNVLSQLSTNPQEAQKWLEDPLIAERINTLVAAGIIRLG